MIPWEEVNKVSLGGAVTLSGLVIVFLALVILIAAVMIMGRVLGAKQKEKLPVDPPPQPVVPVTQEPAQQQSAQQQPEQMAVADEAAVAAISAVMACEQQEMFEEDTVAAISAAVAYIMQETAPGIAYTVTNIQRSNTGTRPVWGFAGMQQNTRPF